MTEEEVVIPNCIARWMRHKKSTAERANCSFCRGQSIENYWKYSTWEGPSRGRDWSRPHSIRQSRLPRSSLKYKYKKTQSAARNRHTSEVEAPRKFKAEVVSAQQTTRLATEKQTFPPGVIRRTSLTNRVGSNPSSLGLPAGVTRESSTQTAFIPTTNTEEPTLKNQNSGSPSACNQQHAIVRVIVAVSSNIFSRTTFAENNSCVS